MNNINKFILIKVGFYFTLYSFIYLFILLYNYLLYEN
jgi:hypothetical protein